jgi:hypothetical protein
LKRISFVAGVLVLISLVTTGFFAIKPQVIYGDDNRQDVYEVKDQALKDAADSALVFIAKSRLFRGDNGAVIIDTKKYGADYNLCPDEPFWGQPIAGNCSGFLVGEDLVATAGHCVSDVECADYSLVFGFKKNSAQDSVDSVPAGEIYNCKEIVAREMTEVLDYALIRLDRPVVGHKPLKMATTQATSGDPVVVIGNPSGLPTKIAGGATVRTQMGDYFITNTDTYGGNSGSAVFNSRTLEVVGILVRGESDFTYDYNRSCTVSYKCGMNDCRGEDVTNIWFIQNAMPK